MDTYQLKELENKFIIGIDPGKNRMIMAGIRVGDKLKKSAKFFQYSKKQHDREIRKDTLKAI